jgi:catechol 2,3-dioxygenase-like lactoylglutathione lyase family enzyme
MIASSYALPMVPVNHLRMVQRVAGPGVDCRSMAETVEKISAVTIRVAKMNESVRFYRDVLGMELLYGGERAGFSSLRAKYAQSAILNLEQGDPATGWGRIIFHVTDVDTVWRHLKDRGFDPELPRDASWGERYFHLPDPDGHELSFARPLVAPSHSNA